ncbi:hypothetical protein BGZ76_006253 [Entomortierella beljakovae]|nr:hypothetical protein BGZ76_006253 [Entomortierella beljakovae]
MAKNMVSSNASAIEIEMTDTVPEYEDTPSIKKTLISGPTGLSSLATSFKRAAFVCFGIRHFDNHSHDTHSGIYLSRPDTCYMGTSVVSGTATVLVEKIGSETFFGSMTKELSMRRPENAFQMGVRNISCVFMGLMLGMVPPVILINGFVHKSWGGAALFALSIAVGLTPEMLSMIVNSNLAREAWMQSSTLDLMVVLVRNLDFHGNASKHSLQLAFLNASFQTGLNNLLDVAMAEYFESTASGLPMYQEESDGEDVALGFAPSAVIVMARNFKLDEIPFDFVRRRMSVILQELSDNSSIMISKGTVEEMLSICTKIVIPLENLDFIDTDLISEDGGISGLDILGDVDRSRIQTLTPEMVSCLIEMNKNLNTDGIRVIAMAYRNLEKSKNKYGVSDECDMIFAGMIGFLNPPKESTAPAMRELLSLGVEVKVLTGDSAAVCLKVCQEIDLPIKSIITTDDLNGLDDEQIVEVAEKGAIFAKLTPLQKSHAIRALKRSDHIVGFLGDGINDASALSEADVSISVDTATDIAKESADVILLEKSLVVISDSVILGRTTYGNTIKYIMTAISLNFGNVSSVLDHMDKEFLAVPRRWSIKSILRFMVFMGPWPSIFDITTFLFTWFYYDIKSAADEAKVTLFQTAWFAEGALSRLLIIYVIRSPNIAFIQTNASLPVMMGTIAISGIVLVLPYIEDFRDLLTLVTLPGLFYDYLIGALISYLTC